jgi:integrase
MDGDGASDAPAVLRATCRELVGVVGAEGCLISRAIGDLLIEVAVRAPDGKDLTLGPRLADPGLTVAPRSPVTPEGVIEPKSRAGRRKVPIVAALRAHLAAHMLRRGNSAGLFFGVGEQPFNRDQLVARGKKAWKKAGVQPLGLHEARHTCASIFIAAGVNLKALSSYLGHASITITLDRYGHLMSGNEGEAVGLVDSYLDRECATVARQS